MSLIDWIKLVHPRLQRRYLEAHRELLSAESEHLFAHIAQQMDDKRLAQRLLRYQALFRQIRTHGGTLAAIRTAFVDQFSGFALDPPSWFESFEKQLIRINASGQLDQYATLLRQAIERTQRDSKVAPEFVAWLQGELGRILTQSCARRVEASQEALQAYRKVLEVYTLARYPHQYAKTMASLGNVYCERLDGERKTNCEQAIACFEAALRTYTSDTLTEDWALIQYNLGNAYRVLFSEGKQSTHLERAISCYKKALLVYILENFPEDFAMAQSYLGYLYFSRSNGERSANLQQAITCYEAALRAYTHGTFPVEWAETQDHLGTTYLEHVHIEEGRKRNLEQAIACYEAALQVFTRNAFPFKRAEIQTNLGTAYARRIEGGSKDNLERAISYYNAALEIFTRDAFPKEWARTQVNLGLAYRERIEGERRANLEQAIACYEAALQVRTRDAFLIEWAKTQINLGVAYCKRIEGERRANLEQAIACYEAALQVLSHDMFPVEWAQIQSELGIAYLERIEGQQRINVEQAIACYEAALQVRTLEAFPVEWARTQGNLGTAYLKRIEAERSANLERAITCYEAPLQIYTREAFPVEWARTHVNLGNVYSERIKGERGVNLKQAIAYSEAALQVFTREAFPIEWANIQGNLGDAYLQLIEGNRSANLEQAITCYKSALAIFTRDSLPLDWANRQDDLGCAYRERLEGERRSNLERAIDHFKAALQIRTLEAFPTNHREIQIRLAEVEAERQNWEAAHFAYARASAAEDMLVGLGTDVAGRDAVLKEGRSTAVHDGFALVRMGRLEAAGITIERGRAKGLSEAMALNAAEPKLIHNTERRERYIAARQQLIYAQATLNALSLTDFPESERRRIMLEYTASCHKAQEAFNRVVIEIRQAQDPPDFLESTLDAATILQTAEQCGQGHAIVYLAATPWGGIAVAAMSPNSQLGTDSRFAALDLPGLTAAFVDELIETKLDDETQRIIGGFAHAQEGRNLGFILHGREDGTLRELAGELVTACKMRGKVSTLAEAALYVLSIPALSSLVERPLRTLSESELYGLSSVVGHFFLQLELRRCLDQLSSLVMRSLIAWLREEGVTSLTFIPCGRLAAFPHTAVPLADRRTLGEALATSVAPSVRSLLRSDDPNKVRRSGVYTLGNPKPTPLELIWGEAEALTLAKVAHNSGLPAHVKVQRNATLEWLIQALRKGYIVDASCHGRFDIDAPLESTLSLARGKYLRLGDVLSHEVDMSGLRLFILSACQTAILDLRGAIDEVRSLAAGMVQAGARAVLAALWSVDDRATYLLIVRFAQEWLPKMEQEPPAAALSRAQHWLRTVINRELQQWEATIPVTTKAEQREAGAEPSAQDDEKERVQEPMTAGQLEAVRGRGNRYTIDEAKEEVRKHASLQDEPDARPYADPIYWAGFQITGW